METDETYVQTSTRTAIIKPKIREGIYAGKLVDVKTKKGDGTPLTNKFGKQAILEFEIYKIIEGDNPETDSIGEQAIFKDGNVEHDVKLSQFINTDYNATTKEGTPINGPDGKQIVRSAFTPPGTKTSRATETFMALGWSGPDGNPFSMKSFVGRWAKIIVEDYDIKNADSTTTVSTIGKVKPYTGKTPAAPQLDVPLKSTTETITQSPPRGEIKPLSEEYLSKVAVAKQQLSEDMLTQRGFDKLMENLRAQYGVE